MDYHGKLTKMPRLDHTNLSCFANLFFVFYLFFMSFVMVISVWFVDEAATQKAFVQHFDGQISRYQKEVCNSFSFFCGFIEPGSLISISNRSYDNLSGVSKIVPLFE